MSRQGHVWRRALLRLRAIRLSTLLSTLLGLVALGLLSVAMPALADEHKLAASGDASSGRASRGGSSSKKPRRGGINPCMTPDPGFGLYEHWSGGVTMGQVLLPKKGGVTKSGNFDVIIHFHGHEPVRKEFVKSAKGIVLVGIDLGIGSGSYAQAFANPNAFPNLVASIEAAVAKHAGVKKARARKIAISSWSAGYGATEAILRQTGGKHIDSVILLDSLHASYDNPQDKNIEASQVDAFVSFAKKAAQRKSFFFMSHSSILPPGYASTTEVAHYVVRRLNGRPRKSARQDVLGLDMFERYDKGNFHMRGYTGDDKPDHCAHIGLMNDVVRVHLNRRWKR